MRRVQASTSSLEIVRVVENGVLPIIAQVLGYQEVSMSQETPHQVAFRDPMWPLTEWTNA